MEISINCSFTNELEGDLSKKNTPRVVQELYSYVEPVTPSNPKLIHVSKELACQLGMRVEELNSEVFEAVITGKTLLRNTKPYAMNYGGHQFGHWAGQLGDGRAINLFQVKSSDKLYTVQLKGAGPTPYSRRGDGFAVLRSSIREYLASEAMHYLGIPTTRALSLALTGDKVNRDKLYDGNSAYELGAIVCRVSPSFIRFGQIELLASRQNSELLHQLVTYICKHHYPSFLPNKEGIIALFRQVMRNTLSMIIDWQRVGFTHGVMNTDNFSILGLTIDYGPFGFLDEFDLNYTPNTTDAQHRRYRFGNQPEVALWNLHKLANALYPLVQEAQPLEDILAEYKHLYNIEYTKMMRKKMGLAKSLVEDEHLIASLIEHLTLQQTDYTIFFRELSHYQLGESINRVIHAFYSPITTKNKKIWEQWFANYDNRLKQEELSQHDRHKMMQLTNPKYILRNYMLQEAIEQAEEGEYTLLNQLFECAKNPYDEQPNMHYYYALRPDWAIDKFGCSMLSCSS